MAATYLRYQIALTNRVVLLLACFAPGAVFSSAESLTGVVYSNEIGNGGHPAGTFELVVAKATFIVEYGEPLERHFRSEKCKDMGAVWTVSVQRTHDSLYASRIVCTGQVDENAHEPWLLIREYMEGWPGSISVSKALSARYRSSLDFGRFIAQVSSGDLNFYFSTGEVGKCLKIVSVDPSKRSRIDANCAVELQGKRVQLLFDVVKGSDSGKWELDGIKVD